MIPGNFDRKCDIDESKILASSTLTDRLLANLDWVRHKSAVMNLKSQEIERGIVSLSSLARSSGAGSSIVEF